MWPGVCVCVISHGLHYDILCDSTLKSEIILQVDTVFAWSVKGQEFPGFVVPNAENSVYGGYCLQIYIMKFYSN